MTAEKLNIGLIEEMKGKIPGGTNLANTLMDIMCIGKEAVYRRLRGEVPFTLAEAAVISRKMGISLDKLVGAQSSGNAIFDLNLINNEEPIETYYSILETIVNVTRQITDDRFSQIGISTNNIPQTFYMKYEMLSKFRLFKWIYQNEKISFTKSLHEMELPQKLIDKQKEYVAEVQKFQLTTYIWDEMLFRTLVNDIKYFASIHLIRPDEVQLIREELIELLNELEGIASKGKYNTGNDVQIYISNINFEATYSYLENSKSHVSFLKVFDINSITSIDANVFHNVKDWIKSLKKFSTLITQSGEMQRIHFFNKQRQAVMEL